MTHAALTEKTNTRWAGATASDLRAVAADTRNQPFYQARALRALHTMAIVAAIDSGAVSVESGGDRETREMHSIYGA